MSKAGEPKQIIYGKCGHRIERLRMGNRRLLWNCPEAGCVQRGAEFGKIELQEKGKVKR